MNANEERKKCTRCKVNLTLDKFTKKRDDTYRKRCIECCVKVVEWNNKNKCPHGKQKSICVECDGVGICKHGKIIYDCILCKGSGICEHNKTRRSCVSCGGSQICVHNKQKSCCKICSDAIEVTIKNMITSSKQSDKKHDRYNANNFIDKCFLESLIEEYPYCYYDDCKVELQYVEYQNDLATIERLDNNVGHIKSNCVICCLGCNRLKKSNYI